jgi:4,5-DOPA dioxygenase extradiol
MTTLMPAIFFGHGNPMNAISSNAYTEAWRRIGEQIARPKVILSISAHWYVPGTGVTINLAPRTIHDFGGFPPALYQVQYAAPGEPALARRVQSLLALLREEDVLIVGSGNLVHNLHAYAWDRQSREPYDWAVRFESAARDFMLAGEFGPLVNYETLGQDALLSIPTPDHYLPLLYVLGCHQMGETVLFPVEGVDGGSISMLSVQIG